MQDVIDFSNAKIYYPEEPKNISASVEHITLTAEQAREQGWHFRYKSGKRVRITRFAGTAADVTVPAEIDGCTVNEIGERCFAQTAVKTVNIPSTVKKLGSNCFFLCAQLEQADMLRSTPKPEEQSTEMYRRFLLKNHHHAVKAAEALSEQWSEYRDFLARFYELNSL